MADSEITVLVAGGKRKRNTNPLGIRAHEERYRNDDDDITSFFSNGGSMGKKEPILSSTRRARVMAGRNIPRHRTIKAKAEKRKAIEPISEIIEIEPETARVTRPTRGYLERRRNAIAHFFIDKFGSPAESTDWNWMLRDIMTVLEIPEGSRKSVRKIFSDIKEAELRKEDYNPAHKKRRQGEQYCIN
jgi:hypothetical protein